MDLSKIFLKKRINNSFIIIKNNLTIYIKQIIQYQSLKFIF